MVAQATSTADDAASEDEPGPVHPYVGALTGLPGVEHVAVVDISGQHVLGEWGGPAGSADPLLARAREAAERSGRRELEDVVSETPSAFHLSRLVLAGPGHPESVWVALRVARAQGSLPWSRAALAGLDGPTGAPMLRPRIPAPRDADDGPMVTGAGPAVPTPRVVPPPPGPAVVPGPVPVRPPRVQVARTPRVVPVPATAAEPEIAQTTEIAEAAQSTGTTAAAEAARPDMVVEVPRAEVPVTVELRLPPAPVPERRPEPPAAEPVRRSSFAPVMVVAPPPSPVPDDDRTEEPAPMPAPVIFAPDPAAELRDDEPRDDEPWDDEPTATPADVTADVPTGAPAADVAVAPKAPEPGPAPAEPATPAPPAAPEARQAPAAAANPDEPRVMRRLIHGFRRRPS